MRNSSTCGIRLAAVILLSAIPLVVCAQQSERVPTRIYVVLYERGPAWIRGKSVREFPDFEQHLAHIRAIERKLVGAGPFTEAPGKMTVGMIIFFAATDADARKLAGSDPFVLRKYTRVTKVLRWNVDKLKGCS
jgi:uncharacterized protein YciI